MFVKLLVLLFYNVFASFSVLLCCRFYVWKCGLKGGIEQGRELAPVSVIERTVPAIERSPHQPAIPMLS